MEEKEENEEIKEIEKIEKNENRDEKEIWIENTDVQGTQPPVQEPVYDSSRPNANVNPYLNRGYGGPDSYDHQGYTNPNGYPPRNYQPQPTNGKATASLVLGIVSLACIFLGFAAVIGVITSIVGLVLGIIAKKETTSGTATTGVILNIIALALCALSFLACMACIGYMAVDPLIW